MPFQKGNKLGGSHKGHPCYNKEKLRDSKWMQKNGKTKRIRTNRMERYLSRGWTLGRPNASEETRQKQSAAGKSNENRARWVTGHKPWNIGASMSDAARISMSLSQLACYGVTRGQIEEAWSNGMSWCSEHLIFEPNDGFAIIKGGRRATRCKMSHKKHSPWFKAQLEKQHGVCALCCGPSTNGRALCVDHDHKCSNPRHTRKHEPLLGCTCSRGLLCANCNFRIEEIERFMTQFGVSTPHPSTWAEKALAYLASYAPLTSGVSLSQESQ